MPDDVECDELTLISLRMSRLIAKERSGLDGLLDVSILANCRSRTVIGRSIGFRNRSYALGGRRSDVASAGPHCLLVGCRADA